jgi:hypothetical protein
MENRRRASLRDVKFPLGFLFWGPVSWRNLCLPNFVAGRLFRSLTPTILLNHNWLVRNTSCRGEPERRTRLRFLEPNETDVAQAPSPKPPPKKTARRPPSDTRLVVPGPFGLGGQQIDGRPTVLHLARQFPPSLPREACTATGWIEKRNRIDYSTPAVLYVLATGPTPCFQACARHVPLQLSISKLTI